MIYLDNAATTFPKPEKVYAEMDRVNRTLSINAGRGAYKSARTAAGMIADTKQKLLELFHADGLANVVLTPSVTYAINQVIYGLNLGEDSIVYCSPYEHNAVARPLELIHKRKNTKYKLLPIKTDFTIDMDNLAFMFASTKPDVIVVNALSNVTGYILPFEEIFALAKKYDCITILDASQAAGLISIDYRNVNADIICFAGHKTLYGPLGVGGFLINKAVKLDVVFSGGTGSDSLNVAMPEKAPERYEAASQNIIAIAGLHASLSILNPKEHYSYVKELTDYAIEKLTEIDEITLYGCNDQNIGILSFTIEGYSSDEVGTILDEEYDIAVRTGYHCAPFIHEYLKDVAYKGTVRVSVGLFNTKDDIDALVEALASLV